MNQMSFKRYEIKYMLTREQADAVKRRFADYMIKDEHGESTIQSLYCDTFDYLLARRSIESPVYKEKLRIRSYGVAKPEDEIFVEIKKKYEKVVYKRRIELLEKDADEFITEKMDFDYIKNRQIKKEIQYFLDRYSNLIPQVLISYDREAFFAKDDRNFRITFDRNITFRDYDLSLCKGIYGERILPEEKVLMEIKTPGAVCLWMLDILRDLKLYKISFSKYGNAYRIIKDKGERRYA